MKNIYSLLFLLFVIVGCAPSQVNPTSTPSPLPPTATSTPTLTPTSTPTITPSPTPTPLELPVLNGTPVPLSNIPISVDNTDMVTELARYWGNPDAIVRVTRDGKTLVMANVEGIYFYDIPSGALLRKIDAHIYFFHLDTWQPLSTYVGHYIAISADGERLAYMDENLFVHVVDAQSNKLFNLDPPAKNPDDIPRMNLELSPNGKFLAITIAGSVQYGERMLLYDVDNGQQLPVNDVSTNVCFTGDGNYLVVDPKLIYTTSDWQKIPPVATKFNTFVTFACDSTSRLAILSEKAIEVWDVSSGQPLAAFQLSDKLHPGTRNAPKEIRFSADGTQLVTFDRFGAKYDRLTVAGLIDIASVRLIEVFDTTPYCVTTDCVLPSIGSIEGLMISPSSRLVPITVGINPLSLPWLEQYYSAAGQRQPSIFEFTGSGNNQQITIASDYGNFVCEMGKNGMSNCPYNGGSNFYHLSARNEYYSYGFCDPRLFTGLYGEYGEQEKKVFSLEPPPGCSNPVRFFGYSPQFNVVLYVIKYEHGTQGSKMFLYDIANHKFINSWKYKEFAYNYRNYSYGILSPSGRYAAILLDRNGTSDQVMVYDLETKELIVNDILKDSFKNNVPSLAFSADEQILAMLSLGSGLNIHILTLNKPATPLYFDLCSSLPETWCPEHSSSAVGFAISPDARLFAVGNSKGEILLVDAENGTVVNRFQAHTGPILRLAFNEEGNLLASLERSGIVKIWGLAP